MTQPDATQLSSQQQQAAEMLAAGKPVAEVAQTIGVDRATVWRWRQLPEFQEHMNELRGLAWRAAADKLRQNAVVAVDVLGSVLTDATVPARDRIAAAREVIRAAGPLFDPAPQGAPTPPVETGGVPALDHSDWRAVIIQTALKATEMQGGNGFLLARTPGAAWAEAGLEAAFPGSYDRLRALADHSEELRATCDKILVQWGDAIDAEAIGEADEDAQG
jgi:transposase-like protein